VRQRAGRRALILAAIGAVVLGLLVVFHRAAALGVLELVVASSVGYHVAAGDVDFTGHHLTVHNLRVVSPRAEPVLDVRQIDVEFRLRDLFPGGEHRYGIVAIDIERPHLIIIRHGDGSYNLALPSMTPNRPQSHEPFELTLRVANGSASLVD